jgi:Sulfatase
MPLSLNMCVTPYVVSRRLALMNGQLETASRAVIDMKVFFHLGLVTAFCFIAVAVARAAEPKPNIVFIMADDLGNADLGYRGGEMSTPNIDKLAKEGVRLEVVLR